MIKHLLKSVDSVKR